MSNYINQVSDSLKNHISELANNPCLFLRNPNVDFSRKRKIDFKTFIGIMMNSGGASPPDVINLIEKHVLPVRPGRKDPRKVKPQASVSFPYRVA